MSKQLGRLGSLRMYQKLKDQQEYFELLARLEQEQLDIGRKDYMRLIDTPVLEATAVETADQIVELDGERIRIKYSHRLKLP